MSGVEKKDLEGRRAKGRKKLNLLGAVSGVDLGDPERAGTLIKNKDGNLLLGSIPMTKQVKTLHFNLKSEA